jgi:hypothetical protein
VATDYKSVSLFGQHYSILTRRRICSSVSQRLESTSLSVCRAASGRRTHHLPSPYSVVLDLFRQSCHAVSTRDGNPKISSNDCSLVRLHDHRLRVCLFTPTALCDPDWATDLIQRFSAPRINSLSVCHSAGDPRNYNLPSPYSAVFDLFRVSCHAVGTRDGNAQISPSGCSCMLLRHPDHRLRVCLLLRTALCDPDLAT